MKFGTITLVGLLIFIGGFATLLANEETEVQPMPPVVSTNWLAEHIDEPDLIVLHMGPQGSFEKQHIPGSRSASLRRLNRTNEAGIRDEMLPADEIAEALSELGISNQSRVVIYFAEEGAAWAVARYLLILEYVGMTGQVAYLDGGLPKWLAEERPVNDESSDFSAAKFDTTIDPDVLVDLKWSAARFDKEGIAFVDGRPPDGYSGLAGHWDRLGHIPGAGNVPFNILLADEPTYILKSREELSKMFNEAGAQPGDTVVIYCGTGLWASLPYLTARYLGFETRLYDGSFQEWSSAKELPVDKQEKN